MYAGIAQHYKNFLCNAKGKLIYKSGNLLGSHILHGRGKHLLFLSIIAKNAKKLWLILPKTF